jgi:hypothetical protein
VNMSVPFCCSSSVSLHVHEITLYSSLAKMVQIPSLFTKV